ncbi:ALF repeat-containing protein [Krasilnikovia sp. MM14-A1004]|uniref:ALF repeat-containing protein n=1 Tax=Krasilnikovia sp. MM14-A1004 TaxID=3373541 RepID=UPI00399D2F65
MRTITRVRSWLAAPVALTVLAGMLHTAPASAAGDAPVVPADRSLVVTTWQQGGAQVRAMAAVALTGSDEQISAFLTTGLQDAQRLDQRDAVVGAIVDGGPSVQAAAQAALNASDGGDTTALPIFLSSGWTSAANIDLRLQVNQLMAAGGEQVREAAQAALDSEDPEVLQEFVDSGWQTQWQTDQRLEINRAMAAGGPQVKAAAQKALDDGSPAAMEQFLTYGWDVAAAHDEETVTLSGLLEQAQSAAAEVDRETARTKEEAQRAAAGAAAAKVAADQAADATRDARDNAAKARAQAVRAANAARKAAQSAQVAIEAAAAASQAARRASAAAARASRAASQAADAASDTYRAAAAAATNRSDEGKARRAADDANRIAQATEDLAGKAGATAKALEQAQAAITSAEAAANQAKLAADANTRTAEWAKQANVDAQEAVSAAAVAQANANRALRAAAAARKYLTVAIKSAYAARDAANAAAADARRAATAAIYAADHAADATEAALMATDYANAATTAAGKVVDLGNQALEIYNAAREADTERLAVVTDEALEAAREANTQYELQLKKADWDIDQAAQRDAETNRLIAEALNPATDPAVAVTDARKVALNLAGAQGVWTRERAMAALSDSDADVLDFVRTGIAKAAGQDNRTAVMDLAVSENTALAAAANAALAGTDATVAQFLSTQNYSGRASQDRLAVNQIMSAARTANRTVTVQRAQAALDNGSLQALRDFLDTGQYTSSAIDDRVQVNQAMADPESGPEVKAAAQVALDGPAINLPEFLRTGRYEAAERDDDTAVHLAVVSGLLEKMNQLGATAVQRAQEAQSTAATARGDATKANEYARAAIDSASRASGYAIKANDYANQAAASAQKAVAAAKTAQDAAVRANTAARSATRSAAWAIASRQHAKESADGAYKAAKQARADAEAAGKDAAAARQAGMAAYDDYQNRKGLEIVNCEHRYNQQAVTDFEKFWTGSSGESWKTCTANIIADPKEMARRAYTNSVYCDAYYPHPQQSQFLQNCLKTVLDPDFKWMSQQNFVTDLVNGVNALILPPVVAIGALCIGTIVCGEVLGTLVSWGNVGLSLYRFVKGDQSLADTLLDLGETALESLLLRGLTKLAGSAFRGLKAVYIAGVNAKKMRALLGAVDLSRLKFGTLVSCILAAPGAAKSAAALRAAAAPGVPPAAGTICKDVVLGLNSVSEGLGSDDLARLLQTKFKINARTYNGKPWGDPDPDTNGALPLWINKVAGAIKDQSVTIHVTVDGLDGTDAFDKIRTAVRRGKTMSPEQAAKSDGTNWELATLFNSIIAGPELGGRELGTVRFYQNGVDITESLRSKFPTTIDGWKEFKGMPK